MVILRIHKKKFLYIIMINTNEIKCSEYPPTIDTIKNDNLRKELESIQDTIKYIRDKKIEDFVTIFRMTIDHTYKIDNPLLIRHFLFKAVEEVNDDLINNNKPYRVNFGYDISTHLLNETKTYWEKNGFSNHDGTLNHFRLGNHMLALDLLTRGYTGDELILFPKELKTDLVVLYLKIFFNYLPSLVIMIIIFRH